MWHQKWTHAVTTGQKWGPLLTQTIPKPTVNIPTVNILIVNMPTVNIPIVKTQINNMRETHKTDKKDTPLARHSRKRGGGLNKYKNMCVFLVLCTCLNSFYHTFTPSPIQPGPASSSASSSARPSQAQPGPAKQASKAKPGSSTSSASPSLRYRMIPG